MGRGGEHNSNQIAFHPEHQPEISVFKITGILIGNSGGRKRRKGGGDCGGHEAP